MASCAAASSPSPAPSSASAAGPISTMHAGEAERDGAPGARAEPALDAEGMGEQQGEQRHGADQDGGQPAVDAHLAPGDQREGDAVAEHAEQQETQPQPAEPPVRRAQQLAERRPDHGLDGEQQQAPSAMRPAAMVSGGISGDRDLDQREGRAPDQRQGERGQQIDAARRGRRRRESRRARRSAVEGGPAQASQAERSARRNRAARRASGRRRWSAQRPCEISRRLAVVLRRIVHLDAHPIGLEAGLSRTPRGPRRATRSVVPARAPPSRNGAPRGN